MLIMALQAIPCVGLIMTAVLAFSDEDETRRNYFKAHLAWIAVGVVLWVSLIALGLASGVQERVHQVLQSVDRPAR